MQLPLVLETFNGGDLLSNAVADGSNAGADRFAVEQDRASSALTLAAAVFATSQIEVIPQDPQQAPLRIGIHPELRPIHIQLGDFRHRSPFLEIPQDFFAANISRQQLRSRQDSSFMVFREAWAFRFK